MTCWARGRLLRGVGMARDLRCGGCRALVRLKVEYRPGWPGTLGPAGQWWSGAAVLHQQGAFQVEKSGKNFENSMLCKFPLCLCPGPPYSHNVEGLS